MMPRTPRTFIGSVVFVLEGPLSAEAADRVRRRLGRRPGISRCDLDPTSGSLLVTAEVPVDRTEVVEVLRSLGCRVDHP